MVDPTLDDDDTLFEMDDMPKREQPPLPKLTPPPPKLAPKQSTPLGRKTPHANGKTEELGDIKDLLDKEPKGNAVFGTKPYSPTRKSPF